MLKYCKNPKDFPLLTTESSSPFPKNFVKVTGQASLELEPDVIEFCIKITSSKPDLPDCRSSVKKREEYISSVLKKNYIKDIASHEMIQKIEKTVASASASRSDSKEKSEEAILKTEFLLEKELFVKTDKISKYLNIVSICTEKLDTNVEVSQPMISFSAAAMDKATKMVLQMAGTNARLKARNLIEEKKSPFKASLGPVLYCIEDSFQIQDSPNNNNHFELLKWKKFNRRINTQITTAYGLVTNSVDKDKRFRTVI